MTDSSSKPDTEHLLKLATYASVTTAIILIIVKLFAYLYTSSVSILASLVDSLMDVGASVINLFAIRYALSPPDEEHRFGHGKAESVAGLAQSMFIAGSGVFLIIESIDRLIHPKPIDETGFGIAVMLFSIVVTVLLLMFQRYVIKQTQSTAIRADALHYRTDLLTNAAIILALLLAQTGWLGFDPVFAILIAFYILHSAWNIGLVAFHDLLDRELSKEKRELIISIAQAHPKVQGMHDLRTRLSGRTEFIQMHLELDDQLPLIEAHAIADEVEEEIMQVIPTAEVVIHQDPASRVDRQALPVFKRLDYM